MPLSIIYTSVTLEVPCNIDESESCSYCLAISCILTFLQHNLFLRDCLIRLKIKGSDNLTSPMHIGEIMAIQYSGSE